MIDGFYFLITIPISQQDVTQKEHCLDTGVVSHFTIASIPSFQRYLTHSVPLQILKMQVQQNPHSSGEKEGKIDPILCLVGIVRCQTVLMRNCAVCAYPLLFQEFVQCPSQHWMKRDAVTELMRMPS